MRAVRHSIRRFSLHCTAMNDWKYSRLERTEAPGATRPPECNRMPALLNLLVRWRWGGGGGGAECRGPSRMVVTRANSDHWSGRQQVIDGAVRMLMEARIDRIDERGQHKQRVTEYASPRTGPQVNMAYCGRRGKPGPRGQRLYFIFGAIEHTT